MSIQSLGLKAYNNALANFTKADKAAKSNTIKPEVKTEKSFSSVLESSLDQVNQLQQDKKAMIKSFASGETQNVHELMISLQKAGLAMSMTSAVRNKVLEAYRELMRMQF